MKCSFVLPAAVGLALGTTACMTASHESSVESAALAKSSTKTVIIQDGNTYGIRTKAGAQFTLQAVKKGETDVADACFLGDAATACEIIGKMLANQRDEFTHGDGEVDGELKNCSPNGDELTYTYHIEVRDDVDESTLKMQKCADAPSATVIKQGGNTFGTDTTADAQFTLQTARSDNDKIADACYVGDAATACKIIARMFKKQREESDSGDGEVDGVLNSCTPDASSLSYSYEIDVRGDVDKGTFEMLPCQ